MIHWLVPSLAAMRPSRVLAIFSTTNGLPVRRVTPPGGAPNGTECCADRVHPTQGGYAIMAGVWWEYLRGLVPPEPVAAGAEAGSL